MSVVKLILETERSVLLIFPWSWANQSKGPKVYRPRSASCLKLCIELQVNPLSLAVPSPLISVAPWRFAHTFRRFPYESDNTVSFSLTNNNKCRLWTVRGRGNGEGGGPLRMLVCDGEILGYKALKSCRAFSCIYNSFIASCKLQINLGALWYGCGIHPIPRKLAARAPMNASVTAPPGQCCDWSTADHVVLILWNKADLQLRFHIRKGNETGRRRSYFDVVLSFVSLFFFLRLRKLRLQATVLQVWKNHISSIGTGIWFRSETNNQEISREQWQTLNCVERKKERERK